MRLAALALLGFLTLSGCDDNEADVLRPGSRDAGAGRDPVPAEDASPRDAGSPPEREAPRDGGDMPRDGQDRGPAGREAGT